MHVKSNEIRDMLDTAAAKSGIAQEHLRNFGDDVADMYRRLIVDRHLTPHGAFDVITDGLVGAISGHERDARTVGRWLMEYSEKYGDRDTFASVGTRVARTMQWLVGAGKSAKAAYKIVTDGLYASEREASVPVGPGRPGQSFDHGEVQITTTLHDIFPRRGSDEDVEPNGNDGTWAWTEDDKQVWVPDQRRTVGPSDTLVPMRGWGHILAIRGRDGRYVGFTDTNAEGLTWDEWAAAAGGKSTSGPKKIEMFRAWAAGEDPSEWRVSPNRRGSKRGPKRGSKRGSKRRTSKKR